MSRLVVLKLPRWRLDRACPILLGLGSGLSFGSPLVLTFPGREKSFTFGFSALAGFSVAGGGGGGAIGWVWEGGPGDDGPERGKTMFAAVAAAL